MSWVLVAQGADVPHYLHACRLLGITVQIQNDYVLLVHQSGVQLLDLVRKASTKGWVRDVPIDALAHAYAADPVQFVKIVACIHVAIGLGEGDVEDIARDLLKLGESTADE